MIVLANVLNYNENLIPLMDPNQDNLEVPTLDYRAPADDLKEKRSTIKWIGDQFCGQWGAVWTGACFFGVIEIAEIIYSTTRIPVFRWLVTAIFMFAPIWVSTLVIWHIWTRLSHEAGVSQSSKATRFILSMICIVTVVYIQVRFPEGGWLWHNYRYRIYWLFNDPYFAVYLIPIIPITVYAIFDVYVHVQRFRNYRKLKSQVR